MLYADLLLRRANLPRFDTTRVAHLESLLARYFASPGNARFSPESVSVVTYGVSPGALGDYGASVHLQGELIGTMLDLLIRDATNGRRTLDDVTRAMMERFSGARGYTRSDVERIVATVCGCPASVHAFFERYVRTAHPIPFDRYLALAGWRTAVSSQPAVDRDGHPVPDLRVYTWLPPGERQLRLILTDPASVWGRAGLHTGDQLVMMNGSSPSSTAEFRSIVGHLRVGDTVTVAVNRARGSSYRVSLVLSQVVQPLVRIVEIQGATARQRELRAGWEEGKP